MPAPKGNKNAVKWTVKTVTQKLDEIERAANDPTCLWLGSALVRAGLYKDVWNYWHEKFADDEVVFRTLKKVEQIFEDRLFDQAAKGTIIPSVAIFGLKNNHGWKDKSEHDVNVFNPVTVNDNVG